jgi:glycosyltransferase involved in cell wall biosynthesis
MRVSVVIPAYNEESTIDRCLTNLLDGPEAENFEIVVVCNGCSDATAEFARAYEPRIKVLETRTGSKPLALNMGDTAVSAFPRFYIDADIIVTQSSVWEVAKILDSGAYHAASPRMDIDLTKANLAVRAYYRVWTSLPYAYCGMVGSGIYGLSFLGRKRFDIFPDIIGDDAFVRLHFSKEERLTVDKARFTIIPPTNINRLIAIKTRSLLGAIELYRKFPSLIQREERGNPSAIIANFREGRQRFDTIIYISIKLFIRINVILRLLSGKWKRWDRDPTSRGESSK